MKARRVHFIGIGGIGVSALARAFLHNGWRVSGSDTTSSPLVQKLKKNGVKVFIGHLAKNIKKSYALVVYSLAVKSDNRERVEAKRLRIPNKSYPEALADFMKKYYTIAISGSHGKSTTTAMLAHILVQAGLDPTVIIGTKLPLFNNKNFRPGKSRYFLVEADEWDRAFLQYCPSIIGVTNVDREHLDTYHGLRNVQAAFGKYVSRLPRDGYLLLNKRDKNSRALATKTPARVIWYGPPRKQWKLKIPGTHNQSNAELAWQAAKVLGVKRSVAVHALAEYPGAWRRLEELNIKNKKLKIKNSVVYSDYAHHPTEIKATLSALREKYPDKKLIVLFQPHQIERLTRLFNAFTRAFSNADEAWFVPTYQVEGREYRGKTRTSEELARKVRGAQYFFSPHAALRALTRRKDLKDCCIVFMGAGSIDEHVRRYLNNQ